MLPPDIVTLDVLFGASQRFQAPVYQRLYVWKQKQFDDLVEDIDTADTTTQHFLGVIVLKSLGSQQGSAAPVTLLIIDGQQRLTTLYLLLLAMAKQASDEKEDDDAEYIWNNFLAETRSPTYRGWPKVIPTLQDRKTFYKILQDALPNVRWNFKQDPAENENPRTSRALLDQWERLQEYVSVRTKPDSVTFNHDEFNRLLDSIKKSLMFINVTLEANDDANLIFSRLNAQGVELELADLARNEVFSKFNSQSAAKAHKFYDDKWQPFEKEFKDGDLSAFFPIYAYIIFNGRITKSAAFPALQKYWSHKKPEAILIELKKYSDFFLSLSGHKELKGVPKSINEQVKRFARMPRTRVTWPFIIETLVATKNNTINADEALKTLKIVERFLVRRALMGWEPTGLHAVFKVLWNKTGGNPNKVLMNIVNNTIKSPGNTELSDFLQKHPSDSRHILSYVLSEYENFVVNRGKFDPANTVSTVEHILPQNLSSKWKTSFTVRQHESLVGLLGNLVPLSAKQNKSLKDQAWSEKKKRFAGSNFKTAVEISRLPRWTPKQLMKRNRNIVAWILERWPDLSSI